MKIKTNWKHDVDGVTFASPAAQRRYLERVEARFYEAVMAAKTPRQFAEATEAHDYVLKALAARM
jgi:hypothetical protein